MLRNWAKDRIRLAWKDAYDIHVWGLHETKYGVDDVRASILLAKWLLEYAKKVPEKPRA